MDMSERGLLGGKATRKPRRGKGIEKKKIEDDRGRVTSDRTWGERKRRRERNNKKKEEEEKI
jgi:hypothetical protein